MNQFQRSSGRSLVCQIVARWSRFCAKQACSSLITGWVFSFAIVSCTQSNSANFGNLTPAATQQSQLKSSVIRLGYQKGGMIPLSHQRGELERELAAQNIKTEWNGPFDRCASLLQAIMGDRTDIGGCGDIPSISGLAAGQPLCIGAVEPPNPASLENAILVRGDSTIQKPADLIGKKAAVNKGGAGEYLLLKVLEKENIPKDKVERVYLSPSDAAPALYEGNVDAWAVWEPYVSIAQLEHGARRITTTHPAPTYEIQLVRTAAASENPMVVKAALTALAKDTKWLNQNPRAAAAFTVRELKVSDAVAQQALKNRGPETVTFPTTADIANLQKTADWMLEQKIIPKRVDIAASICPSSIAFK